MNTQLQIQKWKENQNKVESFRELFNHPLFHEAVLLLKESNSPQPVLFSHWEAAGDKQLPVYGFNQYSESERSHNLARAEGIQHAVNFLEDLTQYAAPVNLKQPSRPFEYPEDKAEMEKLKKATETILSELNQKIDLK